MDSSGSLTWPIPNKETSTQIFLILTQKNQCFKWKNVSCPSERTDHLAHSIKKLKKICIFGTLNKKLNKYLYLPKN